MIVSNAISFSRLDAAQGSDVNVDHAHPSAMSSSNAAFRLNSTWTAPGPSSSQPIVRVPPRDWSSMPASLVDRTRSFDAVHGNQSADGARPVPTFGEWPIHSR